MNALGWKERAQMPDEYFGKELDGPRGGKGVFATRVSKQSA